jgi:hypothetical protein
MAKRKKPNKDLQNTTQTTKRFRKIGLLLTLLSESRAIINDLGVILHGFMLPIFYTTVLLVKRLNNITLKEGVLYGLQPSSH